jgi:hypothetical protein
MGLTKKVGILPKNASGPIPNRWIEGVVNIDEMVTAEMADKNAQTVPLP